MDFGTVNLKLQEELKKELRRLKARSLKELFEFLGFLFVVVVMLFFYAVA